MQIQQASTKEDLLGILEIQTQNHKDNISIDTGSEKGFVTVKHSLELLELMNSHARQVIAKKDGKVIAYALVMVKELEPLIPVLQPLFQKIETVAYKGCHVSDLNFYVMGQICVHDDHKRKGIFKKLYQKHQEFHSNRFDYCLTSVSTSNQPSFLAHKKVGFKTIHRFSDDTDEWNILLWDWKDPAP